MMCHGDMYMYSTTINKQTYTRAHPSKQKAANPHPSLSIWPPTITHKACCVAVVMFDYAQAK